MFRIAAPLALTILAGTAAYAGARQDPLQTAIRQAVSDDPSEQVAGIRSLRDRGEDGLDALIAAKDAGHIDATDGQWNHAIDQVAAQKDAAWSGLFWHTDLEDAKAQAQAENKPILSLRMLGDLREATSCANSRFFRAALYTNPDVAGFMDDAFVLHWSSEREVPQISIRFGDGRELHSTITGNSIHYVLDADGVPIDGIPGLFAPDAFLDALQDASGLAVTLDGRSGEARQAALVAYHTEQREAAVERAQVVGGDFGSASFGGFGGKREKILNAPIVPPLAAQQDLVLMGPETPPNGVPVAAVPAEVAIPMAVGKGIVEQPLVASFMPETVALNPSFYMNPAVLAVTETGTLHERSKDFIRSQNPAGPGASDNDVTWLLQRFETDMRTDSTWNRNVLHARIHNWFANGNTYDFETLNTAVYSQLFATPKSDPWLGLRDPTVYTGLRNGGIVVNSPPVH